MFLEEFCAHMIDEAWKTGLIYGGVMVWCMVD